MLTPNDDKCLFTKIDSQDAENMCSEVTNDEIKKALFDIDDNRSPGPDGEVNATLIALVPKMKTPLKVTDFRPIACCNVVYKCISKILTNMIKHVLNKLVDQNQSAFLPGRAITDNILLTQELLRGYNSRNGPKRCSLKIDIQKAYDIFSICVNGERFGYFKGGRGLRQGDPISPYLFTIIMEVLNLFLKDEIAKERNFKYHFGCKKLKTTHLCFADDLLVLSHGDTISISTIKRALDEFSKIGKLLVRCLGVPLMDKKIGMKDCKSLVDKVRKKLGDWKNKSLSYAGRGFLWCNGELTRGKAKVTWKDVCMPKEQGGLGIKPLEMWNKTLLIKHLWNIAENKESLWVKWINT
ncbi:RNA-directed DNA polymerase, eukaryota, reverse transcriptase zinc-binding domain protein, partial [Tanacetum coccineum]